MVFYAAVRDDSHAVMGGTVPTPRLRETLTPEGVPATRRLHAAPVSSVGYHRVSAARAAQFPTLAHRERKPPHGTGSVKPCSLRGAMPLRSTFGVEVRFLDDRLVDTLDAWLSWGGVRLGAGTSDSGAIAFEDPDHQYLGGAS